LCLVFLLVLSCNITVFSSLRHRVYYAETSFFICFSDVSPETVEKRHSETEVIGRGEEWAQKPHV